MEIKYRFAPLLAALFILSGISLNIFISPTNAQEQNAANANQSATPSPTATPEPTPIPLSDVILQAEETARRLQEIQTGLSENPDVAEVERELPSLTEKLDSLEQETDKTADIAAVVGNASQSRAELEVRQLQIFRLGRMI